MVTDIYNFVKNGKLLNYELCNGFDNLNTKVLAEHNDDYFKYIHTEMVVLKLLENKIYSIKINFIEDSSFSIKDQLIRMDNTFEEVKQILDDNNIGWLFYQRYCFANQVALITEGGILMFFLKDKIINSKIYLDIIILTKEIERIGELKFLDSISNRNYDFST